jgi:hypothetical protein
VSLPLVERALQRFLAAPPAPRGLPMASEAAAPGPQARPGAGQGA